MKVVINTCFGGFGLSQAVIKKLAMEQSSILTVTTEKEYHGDRPRTLGGDKTEDIGDGFEAGKFMQDILYKDGNVFYLDTYKLDRAHPDLIRVVEELGKEASGRFADLKVVEIPDGTEYEVEEYDGREWVSEKHKTWR